MPEQLPPSPAAGMELPQLPQHSRDPSALNNPCQLRVTQPRRGKEESSRGNSEQKHLGEAR